MEQEKLEELMFRYGIMSDEIDDVIDFVSDLLELYAKDVEQKEPYATNTIKRYKTAAYDVYELHEYVGVGL